MDTTIRAGLRVSRGKANMVGWNISSYNKSLAQSALLELPRSKERPVQAWIFSTTNHPEVGFSLAQLLFVFSHGYATAEKEGTKEK